MTTDDDSRLHPQTAVVHPEDDITPGWDAFPVPVARASTVVFPDLATMRSLDWRNDAQWRYGLHATPTSAALAQRLAAIEGGRHALLHPSGLAAIVNVYFGLLRAGDAVLLADNVYGPNRDLADWLARDFGVTVRYYDPMSPGTVDNLIDASTRLIWIEAPGSVTMEVPDVAAITGIARAHGVLSAIDNTYSAGIAFRPFEQGCDISVQALTKYQSGGSDVLMGAVITRESAIHHRIKRARMAMGVGVSSDDCSLILRSLPSLRVRFAQHDCSALTIARWLATREEVAAVLHPALLDCPGHANFLRDFSAAGGLFSFVFRDDIAPAQVDAFCEGLALFKLGWSWGGAHSLVAPYDVASMRSASSWPHRGVLVRLYVGLEEVADLIADIERSLRWAVSH
jgi:cystathionine beta-lyase